jgi:multicomponent Na+:H+ antiporter subunit E
MVHVLGLGLALAGLWILLSGIFQPLILIFGAVSCVLVLYICRRMDVVDHEAVPLQVRFGIIGYWIWLTREIAKSNYDVAKLILDPAMPISPSIIRVKATQTTDVGEAR